MAADGAASPNASARPATAIGVWDKIVARFHAIHIVVALMNLARVPVTHVKWALGTGGGF